MQNSTVTASEEEIQLIEEFRSNPELFDLVSETIKVYKGDPNQFKDLHSIETFLLGKAKAIGNNALGRWAHSLEKEVSRVEKAQKGVRKHSKKNCDLQPC